MTHATQSESTFCIEDIFITHWDEPMEWDDQVFYKTIIHFSEQRDGSIEVSFTDKQNQSNHEYMVGFKKPIAAMRNIFNAINAITSIYGSDRFYYKSSTKRENVYKRFTTLTNKQTLKEA